MPWPHPHVYRAINTSCCHSRAAMGRLSMLTPAAVVSSKMELMIDRDINIPG
jgi:hypothetical protein